MSGQDLWQFVTTTQFWRMSRSTVICALCVFLAILSVQAMFFAAASSERSFGRDDLWRVVNYVCVPAARLGIPFPCAEVHVDRGDDVGWAILPVAANHILTVPTKRMEGIESPAAQATESARYWQAAWDARKLVDASQGRKLPRSRYGLAINSAFARTQDQLHIHTSCIDRSVETALVKERGHIGQQWTRLLTPINGIRYMVRRLNQSDLQDQNVVDLLPEPVRANPADMARQTLVVAGATFDDGSDGYYVLNTQVNGPNHATGEALLDFECR